VKHLHRITAIALLALASVMLSGCGARRDGFDWGRFVLFSAVSGKLLDKGKSVAGLTLTRTVEWKGDTYTDTTITGKDGEFAFPVFKKFEILRQVLPDEPMISQTIETVYQGKNYEIWSLSKGNYDNNGELDYVNFFVNKDGVRFSREVIIDPKKVPITVTCELATEVQLDQYGGASYEWRQRRGPKGALGRYCLVD
jgi:hypothetical protein